MTRQYWPQILLIVFFVSVDIFALTQHNKPMKEPVYNAYRSIWITLWFVLVLGMGGFWDLR